MTISSAETIREQCAMWNALSATWKKWNNVTMQFLDPIGKVMLDTVKWKDHYVVLDVASGTGEPGLSVAPLVKNGKIISTDISEKMTGLARENAFAHHIENFESLTCPADALPFEANYFDVVLCRHGFMFFPDVQKAVNEMSRVLKPGGTITAAVWASPEKNPWATIVTDAFYEHLGVERTPPDAPGIFRCSRTNSMTEYFLKAELKNVFEKEITLALHMDTAEEYWSFRTEMSEIIAGALKKADEAGRSKVKSVVMDALQKFTHKGQIVIPATAIVITAEK